MANGGTIEAVEGPLSSEEDKHLDKEKKVILIVGRTGNGKRSIGNSLLGVSRFETGTYEQTLDLVYKDSDELGVIVCPFIGDTGDDIDANLQEICDAARKLKNIVGDRDIDAILFVLKYGVRFTKQEKDAVQRVKEVFGPDVFKHHIIIAFSYGDLFEQDSLNKSATFLEWCQQQTGDIRNIFVENKYRCILFNNKDNCQNLKSMLKSLFEYINNEETATLHTNSQENVNLDISDNSDKSEPTVNADRKRNEPVMTCEQKVTKYDPNNISNYTKNVKAENNENTGIVSKNAARNFLKSLKKGLVNSFKQIRKNLISGVESTPGDSKNLNGIENKSSEDGEAV